MQYLEALIWPYETILKENIIFNFWTKLVQIGPKTTVVASAWEAVIFLPWRCALRESVVTVIVFNWTDENKPVCHGLQALWSSEDI